MSQKIRIGNDIDITWSLKDADEQPYIVEGKNVEIELNVGTKRVKIKEFELSGNQIHFVYYGKDQKHTGSYALKYIENPDDPNMVTFDTKDAFYMVDHSWLAVDEGETPEAIQLEVVTIGSTLLEKQGPRGYSAYEIAVQEGFVGTVDEWLASLNGDAAGFGEVDAEADANIGTPEVEVSTSGPDTEKNIHFKFKNIKGEKGDEPVLTAGTDGTIYSDGQVLTEVIKDAKTQAGDDHSRAELDHTQASNDHSTASGDHVHAGNDHTQAVSDHGVAAADHTQAGLDHNASTEATAKANNVNATIDGTVVTITDKNGVSTSVDIGFDIYKTYASVVAMNADAANVAEGKFVMIATTDQTSTENARLYVRNENAASSESPFSFLCDLDQAATSAWADWFENYKPTIEADHTRAENDHTLASSDHGTAAADHTQAGNDHTRAEGDHSTAADDHTLAGTDHNTAASDHTLAGTDHQTAASDHTLAGTDHQTAASDHTTASNDHTTAGNDHTTAGNDHTRAESDHTIVQGYDTRLTNVESGVSQLGQEVDEVGGRYVTDEDYIDVITDGDGKILEGHKTDGTKEVNVEAEFNSDVSLQGNKMRTINSLEYIEVVTDEDGKIIEGITQDGRKHISQFDEETEEYIREIAEGGASSPLIDIPLLDANFSSPVPVVVTGTKGNENAEYAFTLPLSDDAFNIRFCFRITENLLNQNKSAVIAKLNDIAAVSASSIALQQWTSSQQYSGQEKTNYWPCLRGGIKFNDDDTAIYRRKNNIGLIAFCIKYTGSESTATIENTGSAMVVKIGSTTHTLSYSQYPTVSELYEALKSIPDITLDYRELNNRNCTDLAIFSESKLKTTMYTAVSGTDDGPITEYVDAAEFMVPYAVDETWHKVEIVKIGNKVYCSVDGILSEMEVTIPVGSVLTLGGACGVLFKDLKIRTESSYDAEVVDGILISSQNPYIIIYEGHGIDKVPSAEATTTGNMNVTVDRLQYVFEKLKSKGYIPVSVFDIAEFYDHSKELPKRCYTLIFDDFRFDNVLDLDNRQVFTRFGVKPALALITDRFEDVTIYLNGEEINGDKAVEIAKIHNFDLISHTRDHRKLDAVKPSETISELILDNYANDLCGVNGEFLVFPGGRTNRYTSWALAWLGYRLGVGVWNGYFSEVDNYNRERMYLVRYEIGMRESMSNILIGIK